MKELIFELVDRYAVWGILILAFAAAFLLWRMHRQLKRLNRSVGMIAGRIQEYFTAVMEGNVQEEPKQIAAGEAGRRDRFLTYEERERIQTEKKKQNSEEEAVFNSVIQEFFS